MKYKLKGEVGLDIIKQVCETRGVNSDRLNEFINPTKDVISNPSIYTNLDIVAKTIIESVNNNLKIGILIDSDCDGYMSSAMVVNYLKEVLGFDKIRLYIHENKEHGLTPYIMKQILELPPDVLIIPDASSSDYKQHKELYDIGVDILIIDHHETDKFSEFAKVVNNQLEPNGNKTLSAGGMVLKVLERIDSILGVRKTEEYYDLASVAMVADCMQMNNLETRYYVQQGLVNIKNPLLSELIKAEGSRSYETISFDIAPTINAFTRMCDIKERQEVFLALIGNTTCREIVIRGQGTFNLPLPEYISKMASRIKSRQTTAVKKALDNEETVIVDVLPFTVCILSDDTLKSLTGLIGNRLTEIYKKPAIVLKRNNKNYLAGSGRTIDTFSEFKDYLINTEMFDFCAGHQEAFGCGITQENLDKLIYEYAGKQQGDWDSYLVDKAYINNVSAFDILSISELNKYWSRGFDKPLFYVKLTDLKSDEVDIIGQKRNTIRIKRDNITYIKFKCEQEEIDLVEKINVNEVELVGHFSVNEYYDNLYPQVLIEDIEFKGNVKEIESNFGFGFFNNIKW